MSLQNASPATVKKYMKLGLNIMLIGPHGVGKTQILEQTAKSLGWKMHSFNAALVDPFVDITGVPQVFGEGEDRTMQLVRNRDLDDADVIFFDEINRANTNVLNAIMNLVNDRKINNEVLPNLKCVVAASNPSADTTTGQSYMVGALDPAQADRFDVTMSLSERASLPYMEKALGNKEVAKVLVDWQHSLEFASGNRERAPYVSPRRLEKLGKLYMKIPQKSTLQHSLGQDAGMLNLSSLHRKLQLALNGEKNEGVGVDAVEAYADKKLGDWFANNKDLFSGMGDSDANKFVKDLRTSAEAQGVDADKLCSAVKGVLMAMLKENNLPGAQQVGITRLYTAISRQTF